MHSLCKTGGRSALALPNGGGSDAPTSPVGSGAAFLWLRALCYLCEGKGLGSRGGGFPV